MSGGQLVVLDRLGRDVKCYPLPSGLATLGSDPACDIRVMLPTVAAHHTTIVVHTNQTVVRNMGDGETLVNGQHVSVAALRHGDVITVGGRSLRWEYNDPAPAAKRQHKLEPALHVARRAGRERASRARRLSGAAPPAALRREPALRLALELTHRASTPGTTGAKQVAIVQPQRRDTNDQNETIPPRSPGQSTKRARASRSEPDATSPTGAAGAGATKASLWIESRKSGPRRATPLRRAVLKRAHGAHAAHAAHAARVTKIEAPLEIDHTKQAAIMLMTGHTPKTRLPSPKSAKKTPKTPVYVVKKPSPVRKSSSTRGRKSGRRSKENSTSTSIGVTPRRASAFTNTRRSSKKSVGDTVTVLEITDSDSQNSTVRGSTALRRSGQKSPQKSPILPSPKKSALKDPKAKKNMRKTESIKFDLSNLENRTHESTNALMSTDTTEQTYYGDSASDDDVTLRYSDSSSIASPSPRRSIHSRSSKMLEKTLGTTINISPSTRTASESPRAKKSLRGSIILQKVLNKTNEAQSSRRSKSASDRSQDTGNAHRTRTLSPRSPSRSELESYSIVDLVSIDSNGSSRSTSVYNSAGSNSTAFGTPQNSTGRKGRSTINPELLSSSTPNVKATRTSTRSQSSPLRKVLNNVSQSRTTLSRRSKSLSTPENTEETKKHISVNSTKISRASKSRSRMNESDLLLVENEDNDDSPKSSKRPSRVTNYASPIHSRNSSKQGTPADSPTGGMSTPENRHSPEEASTPVLSIQSLLDSSQSSFTSQRSQKGRAGSTRSRNSYITKRNTIAGISEPTTRVSLKSKSMNFSARKTRLRLSSDSVLELDNDDSVLTDAEEVVTPKSAVKLVQEAVKNKHSTAKKPQSKRSIIDDLNESDIVKQLFNSPVKRKLSQSMTEFSRKQLFDDDDDVVLAKRLTRNTVAVTGRTPDNSLVNISDSYTPERFVSPLNTPSHSPNLTGIKRLFGKKSPANDLRNVRGVRTLLRTPRARKSIKNDLTNVAGVKAVFARSPRNRLSDVRVKEVFAASPNNDLRRVSGLKSLFQTQEKANSPYNDLSDVRGVKELFEARKSPKNDYRNVSGVKRTMQRNSPINDLSDVRGVKRMFRQEKQSKGLMDISGVEELFNTSNQSYTDTDRLFDQLVGKPTIRAVYSKTFSTTTATKSKTQTRNKSLLITSRVDEWLEQELQKRLHGKTEASKLANRKLNLSRELQKLATNTVEGSEPIRNSRVRNSTLVKSVVADAYERKKSASELYSAHTLPIKKRSLIEVSADKANSSKGNYLPIKKRAVVHSTPVKGRVNMTMNASELGRVSPIAVVDKTANVDQDTSLRRNQQQTFEKPVALRGRRQTRVKNENKSSEAVAPSPKKTRGKTRTTKANQSSPAKANQPSPAKSRATRNNRNKITESETKLVSQEISKVAGPKPKTTKAVSPKASPAKRATRSRKNAVTPEINTKKRMATVVVTKKTPVMTPAPNKKRKQKEAKPVSPKLSPKKTRATRKNNEIEEKVKTPKNTRAKVQRASVVVSKPSPQLKPRAVRARAHVDINEIAHSKRGRKTVESPKENVPKTRGKRIEIAKQEFEERTTNKRARKTKVEPKIDNETKIKIPSKRVRIATEAHSVQAELSTRSRRLKADVSVPEIKSRKRKTTVEDAIPLKVAKSKETAPSRGKKRTMETSESDSGRKKRSVKESKIEIAEQSSDDGKTRTGRSKKLQVTVSEQKITREKRTATVVVESGPEGGKRKRKTTVDPSPVKEASKKQPAGKKSRKTAELASPIKATRARAARAKNGQPEVNTKTSGRNRKK